MSEAGRLADFYRTRAAGLRREAFDLTHLEEKLTMHEMSTRFERIARDLEEISARIDDTEMEVIAARRHNESARVARTSSSP